MALGFVDLEKAFETVSRERDGDGDTTVAGNTRSGSEDG